MRSSSFVLTEYCDASVFLVTYQGKPPMLAKEAQRKIVMPDGSLSLTQTALVNGALPAPQRLVVPPRYHISKHLPLNAEARMVAAVRFASTIGAPIQTMLTVNAEHLQRMGSDSVFDIGHLWDGYRTFLELLRKWVTGRGLVWSCVWCREYTGGRNQYGEHWHIALHLPPRHYEALTAQVAIWTGEAVGTPDGKTKCIARSQTGAWYISRRKENAGDYLGKATPKMRIRYGKPVPNSLRQTDHPYRGDGPIEGKRFGISRPISEGAQRRNGLQ